MLEFGNSATPLVAGNVMSFKFFMNNLTFLLEVNSSSTPNKKFYYNISGLTPTFLDPVNKVSTKLAISFCFV